MPTATESDSATSESGSGVGSRRTAANAERDNVFNRTNADVGVDEAYQLAGLSNTRAWDANVKRTYDVLEEEIHSATKEANAHISELRTVRLQMLTNMATNADALQKQHTAHRDIATDRTWTQVNEMEVAAAAAFASLNAKTGAQADALQALVAKVISDAMAAAK